MKEVIAIIRMDMMNKTKRALTGAGIDAFFAHEAQGRGVGFVNRRLIEGTQHGYEEAASLLGEKGKLYPKRMVTVVVRDTDVADVVEAIVGVNQTGKPGDGKIFVLPVADSVRVRTGEKGLKSIS
ncbi:P-II family nitrogen regulator [Desulfofustis glycolicus]|uniref:Nitrogen regulatory protein P-II family n=1 Tax=Desulfofustis glycolicus DSM 9705 TaxID=1121409 RepID=A0A1M5XUI7_9BACT|nr:P-II family nitrogen regulator [Desulfofustis glycolicus]MCB2217206.1 P-II family nitrogen regulator [Desulfobulbaceae bacterium]SHI03416.1 nitrogen regulatory protein P-II family [Desulfofustis glycolicus DSM 9705]